MVTGYNADTALHVVTGSGVLFKNWNYGTDTVASAIAAGKCIGATQGGVTFVNTPTLRTMQVDGVLGESTLVVKEGSVVTLAANVMEVTAANIALALPGSVSTVDPATGYTKIESENRLMETGDFATNITVIAEEAGSLRPIIIILKNVLSVGAFTFGTADRKEATIPMSFKGHVSPTSNAKDPFEIYYPLIDAVAPTSITLAKGSSNPVGAVVNVAIPAAGATDTTGAATGWVTGTADTIKLTVVDTSPATSTITIGGSAYTSGTDYTIPAASTQTAIVTTTEAGMATCIRTFTIAVTAAP